MIIIQPRSGLANRMRTIDSAIALAEKLDKKLKVIWLLNYECNCKFQDLFNIPKSVNGLIQFKSIKPLGAFYKISYLYYKFFHKYRCFDQKEILEFIDKNEELEKLVAHNNVFISTFSRFYPSSPPFKNFVPQKKLQEVINSYKVEDMIGVHIRRGDNVNSIKYSPLEKFVEYMNEEIKKDSDVKFFLSTDDYEVETYLKDLFPNRVVSHKKKSLNRNSSAGIKDALIDLYCLSKCSKIIGSYWSSFTDTAQEINGIEHIIIKSDSLKNHTS